MTEKDALVHASIAIYALVTKESITNLFSKAHYSIRIARELVEVLKDSNLLDADDKTTNQEESNNGINNR